jgi:hypothetical protein
MIRPFPLQCVLQTVSASRSIENNKWGNLSLAPKLFRQPFYESAFDQDGFDRTVAKNISISRRGSSGIYGNIRCTRLQDAKDGGDRIDRLPQVDPYSVTRTNSQVDQSISEPIRQMVKILVCDCGAFSFLHCDPFGKSLRGADQQLRQGLLNVHEFTP